MKGKKKKRLLLGDGTFLVVFLAVIHTSQVVCWLVGLFLCQVCVTLNEVPL